MLFYATSMTAFLGMAISLWLAAYLLVRGYPSRITLRAVVVVFALGIFFALAYVNVYDQLAGSATWRAVCLFLGLMVWYDVSYKLLPLYSQRRLRWVTWSLYGLGAITIARLLWLQDIFIDEPGNALWVSRVRPGLSYLIYGLFQVVLMTATLNNFRLMRRAGTGPHVHYFLLATGMAALTVAGYGLAPISQLPRVPRLIQDGVILIAILLFGYSVARYQAFVERRTTLQDFPVSGLTIVGLAGIYALLTQGRGFSAEEVALVAVLAIGTHGTYDLVRELLDRLLHRDESRLRQQLRALARDIGGDAPQPHLQQGLAALCRTLGAAGGFIGGQDGDPFVVVVSLNSLEVGERLDGVKKSGELVFAPPVSLADRVAWLALAFAGNEFLGVVGLGPRLTKRQYTEDDLDLLAETADWAGKMIYVHRQQRQGRLQLAQLATEVQIRERDMLSDAEELLAELGSNFDPKFLRLVEEGLRHLGDYTALGESNLTAQLEIGGATHVDRGKALRQELIRAIELLRPTGQQPKEIPPREWQGYVILHDAYIEDMPNREVMAKLYVSESTFNRQRRKALQSVARALLEMKLAGAEAQSAQIRN